MNWSVNDKLVLFIEDSKTSTTLTVGSSSVESCSQGTNDRVFSIHDFYRADTSTPPRFKSFVEVPKELSRTVQEDEEEEEEMGDKILIQLEEASSKESSEMITSMFYKRNISYQPDRISVQILSSTQRKIKTRNIYSTFRSHSFH